MGFPLSANKKHRHDDDAESGNLQNFKPPPLPTIGSWTDHIVVGSGTRKLRMVIAIGGACSCMYALLLVLASYPCQQSVVSKANDSGGLFDGTPSALIHPLHSKEDAHLRTVESASINPIISLPTAHAVAARPSISTTTTNLSHIVFGIATSARLWSKRKEYIQLWWRPREMRGFVWLDRATEQQDWNDSLPSWKISENTDRFKYTYKQGRRSAIRISRIVSETFRLGLPDVHWFVMGDDDTVFVPENLLTVLSKYDHRQYYYIGSSSESHLQNMMFSYNMAYGGGGFAISYPLAKALEKMQDNCIQRYPALYGSDDRIQACMAELGVPLTKEPGFHQYDVYGNLFGLMSAHPLAPVVSLHHLDLVDPILPDRPRLEALKHISKAAKMDPAGFLQQSICYDRKKRWSISISWGFAVQIIRGILPPRELEVPCRTFLNWHKKADYTGYSFNTRPFARHACERPVVFYMEEVGNGLRKQQVVSKYGEGLRKNERRKDECNWKMESPMKIEWIKVVKDRDESLWSKAPRRKCCRIASSTNSSMEIQIGECHQGEDLTLDSISF